MIPTARQAREDAETMGLTGDALDLFVRAGAPERHEARISAALAALLAAAEALPEGSVTSSSVAVEDRVAVRDDGVDLLISTRTAAAAMVLGILDEVGIGGTLGATGAGTLRISGLAGLGKGRKQASDGGAWTSAIASAVSRLRTSLGALEVCPTDGYVGFEVHLADNGSRAVDISVGPEFDAWMHAAASAAICHAANPHRFPLPPLLSNAGPTGYPDRWTHILTATAATADARSWPDRMASTG